MTEQRQEEGPFHEGELEAQRRAGEEQEAARNSPMIGNRIMAGAAQFVREQSMLIVGSRDAEGRLWSSLLFGRPGFLEPAADRGSLRIRLDAELLDPRDPLWNNIAASAQVGMLFIELATRRRIRINGRVAAATPDFLTIQVEESFANCPKYIQRRAIHFGPATTQAQPSQPEKSTDRLQADQRKLIARADTFFVTSAHPGHGLDTSHRGGNPGFVEVLDDRTLQVPDYSGNSMFNTIGNLLVDPRAGLVFPDFERRAFLQATGTVGVLWAKPSDRNGDTGRSWIFHIEEIRQAPMQANVRARFLDYSPFNPATSAPDQCPL